MSFRIRLPKIWDRLRTRFNLEEGNFTWPDSRVLQSVRPITNIDDLLKKNKLVVYDTSITGTGVVTIATVPEGKRWRVKSLYLDDGAGTYTFNAHGFLIDGVQAFVEEFTGANFHTTFYDGQIIEIVEGQTVICNVNTHGVAGAPSIRLLYTEEDAY